MLSKEKFLPTKISNKRSMILIFLLFTIYILQKSRIGTYMDGFVFSYIFIPILWIGVVFFVWSMPQIRPKGLLKLRGFVYQWAFILAIMYIVISVFAGLIDGLGKSPYNHSLTGILTNIVYVGSALVGRELIRSYLVNSFTKKENYFVFILIALLMTITNISFNKFINTSSFSEGVQLLAEFIGPEFAQNLFAVYLVYLGGPLASIIYLGMIQGFHWLSPILTDLKWITTALIGILLPTFFIMTLQTMYHTASKQIKIRNKDEESPISWIITSVLSIGIIWFAVGVFPIYPSVIATGSMEPMIKPGDVILVKKILDMDGIENLKVDDIIQFKRDAILISHRIIKIDNDEEDGLGFRTKGDNNSSSDSDIVKPEDVKGTIVYTVPKIGWPTLLIKSDKDVDLDKIVF